MLRDLTVTDPPPCCPISNSHDQFNLPKDRPPEPQPKGSAFAFRQSRAALLSRSSGTVPSPPHLEFGETRDIQSRVAMHIGMPAAWKDVRSPADALEGETEFFRDAAA